ncbi:sensor histidine kinase [Methylophaga sp. OBS3]|uniref:sensor histidine kinase n=1 Tax=Methylophaga sp. OBS3 TaxID=2991934 RepID=UPI0022525E91|nr:HAMP domain-containing sensor histidine kinase [Methylophaga sp. OBS3]MCX4189667.1 HAMP domain-containing histidine kinase [Methylophaga sp. OBS3]
MTSLKRRLTLGLTITLSILLILQWALISIAIDRLTKSQLSERLQSEAESLLGHLEITPEGALSLDGQVLSSLYQRPFSGRYYIVCNPDTCLQSRSLWDEQLDIERLPAGQRRQTYLAGPQDEALFTQLNGYTKRGVSLTIAIAENIQPIREDRQRFQWLFTLVSATGLLILLGVQWFLVGRALKPMAKIRQQLLRLNKGEAEQISDQGPEEIQPMISALNQLLSTMTRKTQRSRVALGNLAHALKNRLSLLNQTADKPELNAYPELRNQLKITTRELQNIVERELKRARLIGAPLPGQRVDLEQTIAELSHTLQLMHADKSLLIDWQIEPDKQFAGDREDLLELLGNLLDNACKWCEQRIEIQVGQVDGNCQIIIEDDGPGCADADLEKLTQRGFRADESTPGSGLGLAIVYDIVDSYHGNMQFAASTTLGGLKVSVFLPSRP